jgi:hypothetical protein
MKTVAQSDDQSRAVMFDQLRQSCQSRSGVVGWQQHAARREGRAFLKVQIGDREQPLIGPVQRARGIGNERRASDSDLMCGAPARRLKFRNRIGAGGVTNG